MYSANGKRSGTTSVEKPAKTISTTVQGVHRIYCIPDIRSFAAEHVFVRWWRFKLVKAAFYPHISFTCIWCKILKIFLFLHLMPIYRSTSLGS